MALERMDIRAKLDPDTHAQLKAICEIDGVDMGAFVEAVLVPVIEKRVHDAMVLAEKLQRAGIPGRVGPKSGAAGNRER